MKIKDTCIACGACIPYCPMGAISVDDVAVIDRDECVECGVRYCSGVCPVDAIVQEELSWPRTLRRVFAAPNRGRGEMKTNEVTGRFRPGWVGMSFEFGRPGLGTRLRDVDKVTQVLASQGVQFEPRNPVTSLMQDVRTGQMREDVLDEKVMCAVIGCTFPIDKMKDILSAFKEAAPQLDTVVSLGCTMKVEPDNSLGMENALKEMGIPRYANGKTNVGLGKPGRVWQ